MTGIEQLVAEHFGDAAIARVLLVVGDDEVAPQSADGLSVARCSYDELPSAGYDLAIVLESASRLDDERIAELLGTLRNRLCQRVLFMTRSRSDALLRSLGFVPVAPQGGLSVYAYDIDTYNEARDWNNPEDWAHPANFRSRRW